MPGCFYVPGAGARCLSARAVIGASSTARRVAVTSLGANRCARRDADISTLDAADTVMPSASAAACVVTLVDRLIHRSEIVQLDGESYRLREAKEQAAKRSKARSRRSAKSRASRGP